jgi:TPR repeat protein
LKVAAEYFERSAEHENISGRYFLGLRYELLMGVSRNSERAQKYYGLSVLQEDVGWEHKLGFSLENENCCNDRVFQLANYHRRSEGKKDTV